MTHAKKNTSFSKALRMKRLLVLLSLVAAVTVFGYVGLKLYPPFKSHAATVANPPFTRACGLDVALLIDTSASMTGSKYSRAVGGIESFISALQSTDTQYAVGRIDQPSLDKAGTSPFKFTGNPEEAKRQIPSSNPHGFSEIYDLTRIPAVDPRPDRPNLIIILSDFVIVYENTYADAVKQAGTRILAIVYDNQDEDPEDKRRADEAAREIAGPNIDTGSIFTSDVIYASQSTIEALFQELATQLCSPPAPSGPIGPDGPGDGNDGTGTGTDGQGLGPSGGAGGGGSSATTQGDTSNATPTTTGQGDAKEQPQIEPSPFFDGRLFAIGSDSDPNIEKSKTVGIGGLRVGYGWFGVVGILAVLGVAGWFGWKYRKQLKARLSRIRRK